jgi:putative ABC transport system permease protein
MLSDFIFRIRSLFRTRAADAELDEELRFHSERQRDKYVKSGMTLDEATRLVRMEFGGLDQVKEECRDARGTQWIDNFLQDLRYAVRTLSGNRGFAAVAIVSLALGIGANTAIFSLIDSLMLKTLPVSHPEQLLQVIRLKDRDSFSNPVWEQVRDRQDVFSGIFAYSGRRFNLASGGEAQFVQGSFASGQFFETLGVGTVLGRTFTSADDKRGCAGVAVLSYDFWQRAYGGRADVLDKPISLDGHSFPIIGVTHPGFFGVDVGIASDVTVPLCTEAIIRADNSWLDERSARWLSIIARPKSGISPSQATARLKTLAPETFKSTLPRGMRADRQAEYLADSFETKSVASGRSGLRSQYRQALMILMVVVGVVLLIACANVANLLLARGAARQREIAIRMALGSGRARLIRQLLTESMMLSFCGATLGVLLAQWGARLLVGLLSNSRNHVVLDLAINARMLAFTAAAAILTALLFGIAPAVRGTRVQPQAAMKANGRGVIEGSKFGLGKALVMLQVALSLVLVVGAGLLLTTFRTLASLDTGFDRAHVLLVAVDLRNTNYPPERRAASYQLMLDRLRAIPGVRSASRSDMTPIGGGVWDSELLIDGYTAKSHQDVTVNFNQVSAGYFETLGTPFVAGRDFNRHDTPQSPEVAIVNETFVKKYFRSSNPLGRTFRLNNGPGIFPAIEIVGVVKDAKYESLREEIPPTAYRASTQDRPGMPAPSPFTNFELRSAAGAPAALIPSVKAAMEEVNRDITLQFTTLATQVDESLTRERLLAMLSGFFGALALLLATIGLYGVMAYNVARRRNEIGIRMALGAEQSRVLRMVLGEVALLIGIGLVIGLGAAMATTRFVASFLYGIKPNDPWTLSLSAGVLALVAALAGFLPAHRASRLDPMTALREE